MSKRIGLEPQGLARIFGEDDGTAGESATNIAIPAAGSGDGGTAGALDDGTAGLEDGSRQGQAGGQPAARASALADGRAAAGPDGLAEAGTAATREGLAGGGTDRGTAERPAGRIAGAVAAAPAILQAIGAPVGSGGGGGEFAAAVLAVYRTDADKPLTFRFAREENEWLETVCFEVTRAMGIKLHKQDLVRLGLHLVLMDYQRRGERSYAMQLSRKLGRADV